MTTKTNNRRFGTVLRMVATLMLLLTVLNACGSGSIIGTWVQLDDEAKVYYVFEPDGTGRFGSISFSAPEEYAFTWTLEPSSNNPGVQRLKMRVNFMGYSFDMDYNLTKIGSKQIEGYEGSTPFILTKY